MEQVIYLAVGAALTWSFYFIQRRVERRKAVETIERNRKLLELKQGLDGSDTSLEELRAFESRLIGKAETAVRIADRYVSQAEELAQRSFTELRSHDEMHQQAIVEYQTIAARLDALVVHLRSQLDDAGRAAFDPAHLAWLTFRERYARFIAHCYSGGAIRPLIHAVTLESLTAAYIAELQTQLGE
ncbi:MAG TPA: lysozyme inhibitor LprI family protein [Lysobacter sp.]|nr:lysozyme inhibitor LprI family protein [Lysobacter sp.]